MRYAADDNDDDDDDNDDDYDEEETSTSNFFFDFSMPFLRIVWTMLSISVGVILLKLSGATMTLKWMRSLLFVFLTILDLNLLVG